MVIEEMSELAKEICKHQRGKDNSLAIADEVADVYIMLEQVKKICEIPQVLVENRIRFKICRLWKRLKEMKGRE
jgi:NTP pyrophosphatase (non-canonical NTP hydrolase)